MKKNLFALLALTVTSVSAPVWADQALATSKNCMACHATDKKLVGPAYKDVAAKYAGDKSAVDKLATNKVTFKKLVCPFDLDSIFSMQYSVSGLKSVLEFIIENLDSSSV